MLELKPYSASILAFGGFLLIVKGIYFILLRPSLLPKDSVYMRTTFSNIDKNVPSLTDWLQKVFWIMGGYIFTSGLMTIFIAQTSLRERANVASTIITLAGLTSIGFMTNVNFVINSEFK